MDRRIAFSLCLSIGSFAVACGGAPAAPAAKDPAVPSEVVRESDEAAASSASKAEAPKAGVGIDATGNDKELVTIAKQMLACKWDSKGYLPSGCDGAIKAWEAVKMDGKAATLAHFVEDKDPRVKLIGAIGLDGSRDWTADKAIAGTVIDTLEKNPSDEMFSRQLARAAGRVDPTKTGLEERMKKIATQLPDAGTRSDFISSAQFSNRDVFYDTVVSLARTEKNEDVRYYAVSAFWTGTPNDKVADVCALWLEKTKDESERIAAHAAYLAGFNPFGCAKEYDALVKLFEEKTKGKVESTTWSSSIKYMAGNSEVPEKNKKSLVALGKRLAEKKDNSASVRVDGLRAVHAGDKKAGVALAKKLQKDPEKWVKEAADEIANAKSE